MKNKSLIINNPIKISRFCPIWYWCLVFVDDYTSIYPPDVVECYSDE